MPPAAPRRTMAVGSGEGPSTHEAAKANARVGNLVRLAETREAGPQVTYLV